ncbi:MAG: hypothetical protein M3T96_07915 [Acidobacteriota bacterium]|nr:hypothetical protein [Acidobacteriota bacterium]
MKLSPPNPSPKRSGWGRLSVSACIFWIPGFLTAAVWVCAAVCANMRRPRRFFSIPGTASETDREKGLAAGADNYLTETYLDDLNVVIRQNIECAEKSARQSAAGFTPTKRASLEFLERRSFLC